MFKNSLESYLKQILAEEDYPDMEDKRAKALTPDSYPDMEDKRARASDKERQRKQEQEQKELEAIEKQMGDSSGMSSQMAVSGLEPAKKLEKLVSLSKGQMRESFIREQVMLVLKAK
jgi:hypothetical protein